METMRAGVSARIASTTPKASTVTGAKPASTDHTTKPGMKPTSVNVRLLFHIIEDWLSYTKTFLACNCDNYYSTGNCAEGSGQCECKPQFQPPNCDKCSFGYYDYPRCKPCDCHLNGTRDLQCEAKDGQCPCHYNFGGKFCKECADTYFGFPQCEGEF